VILKESGRKWKVWEKTPSSVSDQGIKKQPQLNFLG
jgi:hypothetical protein